MSIRILNLTNTDENNQPVLFIESKRKNVIEREECSIYYSNIRIRIFKSDNHGKNPTNWISYISIRCTIESINSFRITQYPRGNFICKVNFGPRNYAYLINEL